MRKQIEIEGEKIYLNKSKFFGWSVIHPDYNEDGSINWFNFITGGSYARLILMGVIVFVILGFLYEYSTLATLYMKCRQTLGVIEIVP